MSGQPSLSMSTISTCGAFVGNGTTELGILDNCRASIYCDGQHDPRQTSVPWDYSREHYWTTDDGYHWYAEGSCGFGAGTQLEDYERVEIEDREEWEQGKLCVLEDGTGLCPICGAELKASMY